MTIDDKIRHEKLQYNINTKALSSGKIDKYEYLKGQEILHPDKSRMIEQANFTLFSFTKSFGKANKASGCNGTRTTTT